MKNITASQINRNLRLMKSKGIMPVTSLQKVQQEFAIILSPSGKSENSGLILSYDQAYTVLKKVFPNEEFTKEQYQNMLNELYETYSDRLTYRGEIRHQREYAIDYISDYLGEDFANKADKLSSRRLTQLFRDAKEKSAEKTDPNYDANNFQVNLQKLIEENT